MVCHAAKTRWLDSRVSSWDTVGRTVFRTLMQISVTKRRSTIFRDFEMLHHRQAVNNTFFIRSYQSVGSVFAIHFVNWLNRLRTLLQKRKDPPTYRAITAPLRLSDWICLLVRYTVYPIGWCGTRFRGCKVVRVRSLNFSTTRLFMIFTPYLIFLQSLWMYYLAF